MVILILQIFKWTVAVKVTSYYIDWHKVIQSNNINLMLRSRECDLFPLHWMIIMLCSLQYWQALGPNPCIRDVVSRLSSFPIIQLAFNSFQDWSNLPRFTQILCYTHLALSHMRHWNIFLINIFPCADCIFTAVLLCSDTYLMSYNSWFPMWYNTTYIIMEGEFGFHLYTTHIIRKQVSALFIWTLRMRVLTMTTIKNWTFMCTEYCLIKYCEPHTHDTVQYSCIKGMSKIILEKCSNLEFGFWWWIDNIKWHHNVIHYCTVVKQWHGTLMRRSLKDQDLPQPQSQMPAAPLGS